MTYRTEGIRSTAPVSWRSFGGLCGVCWTAQGAPGATGYYISPDPRVMLFFDDVSAQIRVSDSSDDITTEARPLLRAIFVPAGVPMWTRFFAGHRFSHLDLHISRDWLLRRLEPLMGRSEAQAALQRPVESQDVQALEVVARALAQEIARPTRHEIFAESLAFSLIAGLLDFGSGREIEAPVTGGLTPSQVRRLRSLVEASGGARLSNAILAETVGLSESWFGQAFKKTMGKTPLQWQQEQRIAQAKELLVVDGTLRIAEIADRFGFADQAHFTRVFRQCEGTTPASWRRARRGG